MTREQAKELLPILKAYSEGKTIQIKSRQGNDTWGDVPDPNFCSSLDTWEYRIKPEPRTFKIAVSKDPKYKDELAREGYMYNYPGWEFIEVKEILPE